MRRLFRKLAGAAGPEPKAGFVDGRHYTEWVESVKQLKRDDEIDAAIGLLSKRVAAVEDEAQAEGIEAAPWYTEQLAICYRKQKDYDAEIAVLERYTSLSDLPSNRPQELLARLEKARQLRADSSR